MSSSVAQGRDKIVRYFILLIKSRIVCSFRDFCVNLHQIIYKKYDCVMFVSLKVSAFWRYCASLFDNGHPVNFFRVSPLCKSMSRVLITTFFIIMVI